MISVRNLQRPLSGNRSVCASLVLALLILAGCGILRPVVKQDDDARPDDVVKGSPSKPEIEVDTIKWVQVPEDEAPPIRERTPGKIGEFKSVYNLVLLAPFGANQLQSENDRPPARMVRMIEFLAGVQYGLNFSLPDVNIRLQVIDTEQDPQFEKNFLRHEAIKEADVIIGPYYTNQVEAVSQYAFNESKILISPWNTSDLQNANPYYIQMRPSLKSHAKKIVDFAHANFSEDQIMLLTKNDQRDIEALTYFQDPVGEKLKEKVIKDVGASGLTDSLFDYIQMKGYRSFIIPVWQDEPFVIAALSKLNFAKGDQHVTVLGLPQWMEMSRMDYDYFENLHVHLSSARPAAYNSKEAQDLRSNYIEAYGDTPGMDAYYGLNLIKWLGYLLKSEGTDITKGLDLQVPDLDQVFEFTAVFGEDGEKIHHYENQKVHMLRFANYRFDQVD